MNGTVIVWDLETVPDLRGFAAANDLAGKTDDEVREVLGNKFPKHIYHSIACIGALVAHRESDHWQIDAIGAPLDLCDVLSSFAPHTKASLNELSKLMGMPGKPRGIDGAEVERYFLEGKIKEIADYCETDKGRKDRYVMLSEQLLGILRDYWKRERPQAARRL
jgi:predicted PolB exonuclease-like 3'-5' exonuclease